MASVEGGGEMEVTTNEAKRLSYLYPQVDEKDTYLPRQWSSKDKYSYIGLSQNNLRVHYKGTYIYIHVHKPLTFMKPNHTSI